MDDDEAYLTDETVEAEKEEEEDSDAWISDDAFWEESSEESQVQSPNLRIRIPPAVGENSRRVPDAPRSPPPQQENNREGKDENARKKIKIIF